VAKPSTSEKFAQCQSRLVPADPLQRSQVRMSGRPPTHLGGTSSRVNVAREGEIPRQMGQAYPCPRCAGATSPKAWTPLRNQLCFDIASTQSLMGPNLSTLTRGRWPAGESFVGQEHVLPVGKIAFQYTETSRCAASRRNDWRRSLA
jgi:hypothetical protein